MRWSESGNARVGGAVFQLGPAAFGIAAANQFTGEIDLWRMDDSTVGAPISVGLDGKCPNPIDRISIEEGRLTDSQGRSVDFRHTVLIMTSNLGTADLRKAQIGFGPGDEAVSYEQMTDLTLWEDAKKVMK